MLKNLFLSILIATAGIGVAVQDAEAKRLGGGKSFGMQRQVSPQRQAAPPTAAPQQNAAARPAPGAQPAAAQSGWRKWAAPLAGLAAGIGLAALLSHFGIGAEFAGILLAVLAAVVVFALIRRFMRPTQSPQPAYAGQGTFAEQPARFQPQMPAGGTHAQDACNIPADFDVPAFVHQAKVGFVRLQAANDAGDLQDIREFTTPEMFAEIKLALDQRGGSPQKTDVLMLEAEVLEVAEEAGRYIVSVQFSGQIREERDAAPTSFAEIWHLSKPVDGNRGWTLAGIQQL